MQAAQIMQIGFLAIFASGALFGCSPEARTGAGTSAQGEGESASRQATESPPHTAPAAGGASATAIHEGDGAAGGSTAPARLTPELHAKFIRGLPLAEARALTAIAPVRVGGDGKSTEIFRWTDEDGNNFTARFDSGVLKTKTSLGIQRAAVGDAPPETAGGPPDLGQMPVAQIAPGVYIPLDRAVASATGQPMGVTELPAAPAPAAPPVRWTPPEPRTAPDGPKVVVAGAARRAREAAAHPGASGSSAYNPRASLPAFTRSLREGSFEVRFVNPGDAPVSAGLRQDKLGLDTTVPPGGQASLKVDRGVYELYFVRASEPYTRHEAGPVTIDGFQATDVEITLDPADVAVRLIDYSMPEQ